MTELYDEAFEPRESLHPKDIEEGEVQDELSEDEAALLYNGHLTSEVHLGNRVIRLRTLKIGEELEAALLASRWKDTAEASRALVTAYVAAAITSVDGSPLVTALGPGEKEHELKFHHILSNWYWQPTISAVYEEYNNLLRRVSEAQESLKKG